MKHIQHIQRIQHSTRIRHVEHIRHIQHTRRIRHIQHIHHIQHMQHVQHIQHLQHLQHLQHIQRMQRIQPTAKAQRCHCPGPAGSRRPRKHEKIVRMSLGAHSRQRMFMTAVNLCVVIIYFVRVLDGDSSLLLSRSSVLQRFRQGSSLFFSAPNTT